MDFVDGKLSVHGTFLCTNPRKISKKNSKDHKFDIN
jgi:hypothetical protein